MMTPRIITSNKGLNILTSPQAASAVTPAQRQLQCLTALLLWGRESRSPAEIRKTFPPAANGTCSYARRIFFPSLAAPGPCKSSPQHSPCSMQAALVCNGLFALEVQPARPPRISFTPGDSLFQSQRGNVQAERIPSAWGCWRAMQEPAWCAQEGRSCIIFCCSCLGRCRFGKRGGRRC